MSGQLSRPAESSPERAHGCTLSFLMPFNAFCRHSGHSLPFLFGLHFEEASLLVSGPSDFLNEPFFASHLFLFPLFPLFSCSLDSFSPSDSIDSCLLFIMSIRINCLDMIR